MAISPKVLYLSAEVAPYAKVGGLADVAGSLPSALQALGCDVRVCMPAYGLALQQLHRNVDVEHLPIRMSPQSTLRGELTVATTQHEVPLWLLDADSLFGQIHESRDVYSPGRDAYLTYSVAALEACLHSGWVPDLIHCNDWHTGFVPVLLRERFTASFQETAAVYTIHNLAYQGEFGIDTLDVVGLPHSLFNAHQLETFGSVNFLKAGCVYSDQVNTVSPTYAREIQTSEYGCRLEGLMRHLCQEDRLSGILNGIDTEEFNPATDLNLPAQYSAQDMNGKSICRKELLRELNLPSQIRGPVMGMVTRISSQKGFDVLLDAASGLLRHNGALIVQGLGDPWAAYELRELERQYPKSVRFIERFDADLAQRVYAGSDVLLMPSAFEPCGLGQMIAMRYGTIPVVRSTGGLADTVFEGDNGFVFQAKRAEDLIAAMDRACIVYSTKEQWKSLQRRAMGIDHSWGVSARYYLEMYRKAIVSRRGTSLRAVV